MSEEQRDRQNLNLITGTHSIHSDRIGGHRKYNATEAGYWNRWIRISLKAQDKKTIFSNIHTHINVDSLKEAFDAIDGKKALGVDGISKASYKKNLDENLRRLTEAIQRGTYRPQPKREVLIPKANGKTRPIAIACFEDKLVDWGRKNSIYDLRANFHTHLIWISSKQVCGRRCQCNLQFIAAEQKATYSRNRLL
jgi:retron-type reverse transcriptase